MRRASILAPVIGGVALALAACGSDNTGPGGGGGGTGTLALERTASTNGDGQVAAPGAAITNPLRVLVTRNGAPASGVTVSWSATAGTVAASSVSDGSGIATTSWTLGGTSGLQTATASVTGGASVAFAAFAVPAAGAIVDVQNNTFVGERPGSGTSPISVARGTTVHWLWRRGSVNHNVTVTGQPAGGGWAGSPGTQSGPAFYAATFSTAGSYTYQCTVHSGMTGTVTVTP